MLRRIYDLQRAAHGPSDARCAATRQKILTIRGQQIEASKNTSFEKQHRPSRASAQPRAPQAKTEAELKVPEPPGDNGGETAATGSKHLRQPSESSSRCTGSNGNSNQNGGNGGKVKNSMFKAIRSLGRSKKN